MPRTTQLRTYTVRDGMLDEWVERWRTEIVPLRLELGFAIGGAWIDRERNRFLWLISYEGPETFAERNALYWASPEREAMGLDPDEYLVRTDDRTVETVDPQG
ncbi:NIPSNAP family protein [Streptomyces sp. JNUCC 64]